MIRRILAPARAFAVLFVILAGWSSRSVQAQIVTDLAVMDITPDGFLLKERAPGISVEEIKKATAGKLIVEGDVPEMKID